MRVCQMMLLKITFVLLLLAKINGRIYVYNTFDSSSVQFYDCILHEGLFYCRRPVQPIPLYRDNDRTQCHHNGTPHSFLNLRKKGVTISTVMHQWKSSIEKAEQYSRFIRSESLVDEFLCECREVQSFGKNCEYRLPEEKTFAQTLTFQNTLKRYNPRYVQLYGDIICYTTLECNRGLLCLDWRDICDGIQQCMSGLDEENCDKLEFNECEDDEYRCMNGMCIPEEYFLDGEFDCLDWSDEIQYYEDTNCPITEASAQCDDRLCPPNRFSCGDGQCIADRFEFQRFSQNKSECRSRREQYFICETHFLRSKWTLPTGRCYENSEYQANLTTSDDRCEYLLKCGLTRGMEMQCPCGRYNSCTPLVNAACPKLIQYPKAGALVPYILFIFNRTRDFSSARPDFFWINGTIKCDGYLTKIPGYRFTYISTLQQIEDTVCRYATNVSNITNQSSSHQCAHHDITFNNRSYSKSNICYRSKECISTYRIKDGFVNCVDKMDETTSITVSKVCSSLQSYRFRCSPTEYTCLSVTALGNVQRDCDNAFDERWFGTSTKLADISCNRLWKDQCENLKEYIENSWKEDGTNHISHQLRIPFRHYCDTLWNLACKEDEDTKECQVWWTCSDEQWQCDTGQCIDEKWVLDGEWDCSDASDELNPLTSMFSVRNLGVVSPATLKNRSLYLNRQRPFASLCNETTELPCFRVNMSNSLTISKDNPPCIDKSRIGDGYVDCYGAIDERNTRTHCNRETMLGYNFRCQSSDQCIPYWYHCLEERCEKRSDDQFWCSRRENISSNCNSFSDSVCLNGTCVKNARCNGTSECPFGEDEYMCEYQSMSKLTGLPYRKDKESTTKNTVQKLRLIHFPTDSNVTELSSVDVPATTSTALSVTISSNASNSPVAYWCNRGVGVYMHNGSFACFCPPQYYGDKCQYHADRITVLFHLDLSQSIYTVNSDTQIVLKMLVLFCFNNQTITNQIFHVRPAAEILVYSKKLIHFPYPRSLELLAHKRQRYDSPSNITTDQPYSIRIEMYERQNSEEPRLIAVWQYPIYFDYLPVFRFSKVLRLTKPNPCLSNPCHANEDCQQLMNEKSKYICLCKSDFTGENCTRRDDQCATGYCASGSLCKPNYRGLLIGNELPYCVCAFDFYGERCDMKHDQCLSNPCENNGTCFSTSKPDTFVCLCTEEHHGKTCQSRKSEIQIHIKQIAPHTAAVVQYFNIDLISLHLVLVNQQIHRTLPSLLEYRHEQKVAPDIVLVKLYPSQLDSPAEVYLLSVHTNVATIHAISEVTQKNRCVDIRTLYSNNQTTYIDSPIHYHSLCWKYSDLLCFQDDYYLCICQEDHSRVDGFRYDFKSDQCSHCLAGGRCLQGERTRAKNFICLCPSCHSGARCQFNSKSFAFTLDQLLYTDLISIHQKTTVRLLIIIPIVLFLLALPNNFFSIMTFRRPNCLCNGVGQYLLYMSLINQLNLGLLASRLIHIAVNIIGFYSHPPANHYLCKILTYLLTSSSRMVYWLSSLVAIERVYMTLFLNGRWLRKPYIARRLIVLTLVVISLSGAHELVFVKSLLEVNGENTGMCVIEFPLHNQSTWPLIHLVLSVINSILPFLINICCTITISCVVAKTKLKAHQASSSFANRITNRSVWFHLRSRFSFIIEVLNEHKELVIGPGLTLVPQLFSLPLFVISFTLYCQNLESSWVRYLLMASYFTSFIPQLTSFMLYVSSSSFYSAEWRETKIARWISNLFLYRRSESTSPRTSSE